MTDSKRIACLANSRKLTGRCVAGREIKGRKGGKWIRPVSSRPGREVDEYERQYEDGSDPCVLDIIRIPVKEPIPEAWQTENWLLHPEYYWKKEGTWSWFDLPALLDPVAPLWIDGYHTFHGSDDKVPEESMRLVSSSLRLIHAERIELAVFSPSEAFGNRKRRVQAQFRHAGIDYALWVTDPAYERKYLAKLNGEYHIRECYLTISLGEPYQGACYKLVAAIIEGDRRA